MFKKDNYESMFHVKHEISTEIVNYYNLVCLGLFIFIKILLFVLCSTWNMEFINSFSGILIIWFTCYMY